MATADLPGSVIGAGAIPGPPFGPPAAPAAPVSAPQAIVGVRSLKQTDVETLFFLDREWARREGLKLEVYAQLGADFVIIHPAMSSAQSLDVIYTKVTNDLTIPPSALLAGASNDPETNVTELPDEHLPLAMRLTEALIYLRQRRIPEAQGAMMQFLTDLPRHKRAQI